MTSNAHLIAPSPSLSPPSRRARTLTALVVAAGTAIALPLVGPSSSASSTPVVVNLGTLGSTYAGAKAINDAGVVTGGSDTATQDLHAFRWTKQAGMVDLGTLGGKDSYGESIN